MILITGATGYIGKDLVKQLENKYDIRILTRREGDYPFDVVRGSVTDLKSVEKATKDVDCVIHLAASGNLFSNSELFNTNVRGTENVIKASIKNKVGKIVHMSSMAAAMPIKTAYGESKRLAEKVVEKYWDKIDIPILRAPLVYDSEKLKNLRKFFVLPMTSKNFKVHLIYKKSLVDAIEKSLKNGKSEYYNIADKNSIFFHDFHRAVLNTNLKPLHIPHFLIGFPLAFSYAIKYGSNLIGVNSPITPEFITHLFQDREFDISHSVRTLKYKPVNTLKTIKELL